MNEVIKILEKVGAIIPNDHFVGTSGLHFDTYINKDFLYPHTEETSYVCKLLAEKYKDKNIEVVVGPALGGIVLSQWIAFHLSKIYGKEVLGIYTEKNNEGGQNFTRGYDAYIKNRRILVVEDIATTGGSIQKVITAVNNAAGEVISAAVLINKNPSRVDSLFLGVPLESLSEYIVETYEEKNCPLCKKNIPINVKFGHGKKYLEKLNGLK